MSFYQQCKNDKKDCIHNKNGYCVVLKDTNFIKNGLKKTCPFYKSIKEYKEIFNDIQFTEE